MGTNWAFRIPSASANNYFRIANPYTPCSWGYYAWGETTTKDVYSESTYKYAQKKGNKYYYDVIGKHIAGTKYDAATANWGCPWVMPSQEQMEEMLHSCTSGMANENGVYGRRFTGPNGASIFLPVAGERMEDGLRYDGSEGYYWSSTLNESYTNLAYALDFNSGYVNTNYYYGRHGGLSVRPVRKN